MANTLNITDLDADQLNLVFEYPKTVARLLNEGKSTQAIITALLLMDARKAIVDYHNKTNGRYIGR